LSLVSLIELLSVTHLNIGAFRVFPAMALSGCSNLISLQLGGLELAPPEVNRVISCSTIPKPVSLNIRKGVYGLAALLKFASLHGPIVDFSCIRKVKFGVESQGDVDNVNELIKVTTRLEYLYIKSE
jgi:hypothetical protein